MSHIKTIEDLNTSVGELAGLMKDTFTCCTKNCEAVLQYIGKKETNFKIYYKLVQVNILLNKLSEELVGLRVEFVTVSSFEQRRETALSEGARKRRISDVLRLDGHETKSIKMEVPFSSNTKCCIALTSEPGINMQSENLVSTDTEETRCSQLQKSDMHTTKNIKSEVQDSNEVEVLLVAPIGNSEIPAAQTSCDTRNNRVAVCFADDEESIFIVDKPVRGNAYGKLDDMITQGGNTEECLPLQNNQEKYEDNGSVHSKDGGIRRCLEGEVDSTTSFSYQPKRPLSSNEPSVASTASNTEFDGLFEGGLNNGNNDQSSEEVCNSDDELYGVIRQRNGRFRCTLCNCELVNYQAVHVHVKGKKHKTKQISAKKNICARVSEIPNDSCDSDLVNNQTVCGLVKGKKHKMKRKTAKKNSCFKVSEVTNYSCNSELVNYQAVHGCVKGKKRKMKRIIAKNSCAKESKVTSNSCENELANCQVVLGQGVVLGHAKGKNIGRKQKTDKNSCLKESEVTNNTTQCKVM